MKILSVETLRDLIGKHGFENYMRDLIARLRDDFSRWQEFQMMPRPAMHVPGGVLELMPVCDKKYFTFKYVNCHPKNTGMGLMTIVATGQLARIDTGYPMLISEMTILTALRTSATTALVTDIMARKDSKTLAIIGTGAQSEFLTRAIRLVRDITEVRFFDIDPQAMDKFEKNFKDAGFRLVRARDAEEAVRGADIITVCTACRAHVDVIKNEWVKEGVHINGLGGDSAGKTELEASILDRARIVVEYFDQSIIEGEIQRWDREAAKGKVHEIHEILSGEYVAREKDSDITLYDSVGIGLEDFSALTLTNELLDAYEMGGKGDLVPMLKDPKNLISQVI